MKAKWGVKLSALDIKMRPALIAVDRIWKKYKQIPVITDTDSNGHSAGSLHYYGLAFDVRSRYFTEATKAKVVAELKKALAGQQFDIVSEVTHIHIEKDESN